MNEVIAASKAYSLVLLIAGGVAGGLGIVLAVLNEGLSRRQRKDVGRALRGLVESATDAETLETLRSILDSAREMSLTAVASRPGGEKELKDSLERLRIVLKSLGGPPKG